MRIQYPPGFRLAVRGCNELWTVLHSRYSPKAGTYVYTVTYLRYVRDFSASILVPYSKPII